MSADAATVRGVWEPDAGPAYAPAEPVSVFDAEGLEQVRRALRLDPHHLNRFRNRILRAGWSDDEALAVVPAAVREGLGRQVRGSHLTVCSALRSDRDDAGKLLLATDDGLPVETVVMRAAAGRASVCVSSQVGCACGCRFCATGALGLERNLSTDEILSQVLEAVRLLRARGGVVRNVVFMGMGEPLLNAAAVSTAVGVLTDPRAFGIWPPRVMVSTCGMPAAMVAFSRTFPQVSLALSLHSVRPSVRAWLMPVAARVPLECLRAALATVGASTMPPVMVEYLLLSGINDSMADAAELAAFLDDLPVSVNLLRYNPVYDTDARFAAASPEREWAFRQVLERTGLRVTARFSLGADIGAACGQLAARRRSSISSIKSEQAVDKAVGDTYI